MLAIIENKWDVKYIRLLPTPTEVLRKILEKAFIRRPSLLRNLLNVNYHAP